MTRRGFLGRLLALPLAAAAVVRQASTVPTLMFHPDAFRVAMDPIARIDVLYGYRVLRPSLACRVLGDGEGGDDESTGQVDQE